MCGIAGCLEFGAATPQRALLDVARGMADRISYRGPDDSGAWADERAGIAMGHRRLSIIDLSAAGHQPMVSTDGRYVVAYNGEIYNYKELRHRLERCGQTFRGQSDTEVILAAIVEWDLDPALRAFNGMFAIALWDRRERILTLARDRFGEKPLYYAHHGGTLLFASELKALRMHPAFVPAIDRAAIAQLLRFSYVPGPRSIYEGVRKLSPGCVIQIGRPADVEQAPRAYWSIDAVASDGVGNRFAGSEEDAVAELERLLRDAVRLRMISDVPLGAFLSGGLDSSTIVALMQAESSRPVKTFTIGFHERGFNEAASARAVANHLGTEHTELFVTPTEAQEVIPRLSSIYDEPFADVSQIPTTLLAQFARRHVTVALSGDAGDELFGGYTRYFWAQNLWRCARVLPAAVRRTIGAVVSRAQPARLDSATEWVPAWIRDRRPGDKLDRVAALLSSADDQHRLYLELLSTWTHPERIAVGATSAGTALTKHADELGISSFPEQMMLADTRQYLPDDILVKIDRATMAASLESRVPFLDPRVAAFAWRLPPRMKVRRGLGKWPLRRVLAKHVPPALFERPKMGFGVPIGAWLRGPLREWAESLLDPRALVRSGFLDPAPVLAAWRDHVSGRRHKHYHLWPILMFQAWLESSLR